MFSFVDAAYIYNDDVVPNFPRQFDRFALRRLGKCVRITAARAAGTKFSQRISQLIWLKSNAPFPKQLACKPDPPVEYPGPTKPYY